MWIFNALSLFISTMRIGSPSLFLSSDAHWSGIERSEGVAPIEGREHASHNCYIESFNGSFRSECLNVHWFASLAEAQSVIEAWRRDYNESCPHTSLKDMTPAEFARRAGEIRQVLMGKPAEN